ncbi:MAG: hypothetical protein KDK33_13095 [Leptospiraceae bacterium]|nr:hypothetical protein [Leptospiraceae bacterium]
MFRFSSKTSGSSLFRTGPLAWAVLVAIFAASYLHADTVILKNGVIIEGVVYDQNPYMLRVQRDQGSAITIRKNQVVKVIYGSESVKDLEKEKEQKPEITPKPAEKKKPEIKKPTNVEPRIEDKKPETTERKPPEERPQNKKEPQEQPIRKDMQAPLADSLSAPFIADLRGAPGNPKEKDLSRAHSLIYGQGKDAQELILRDEPHSPVIDLNRVVVSPVDPDSDGRLRIYQTEDGGPVAIVAVDYSRAGINVPQAIRDGRILEHEVILRDHKGEILGRAPLNFSSFRFERVTEQRKARRFLILPNATSVTVEETEDPEPVTRLIAHIKNYTDRDSIPQSIELKRMPDDGYPVTLQVRMVLIDPYVAPLCKECMEDALYAQARSEYDAALQKLQRLQDHPELLTSDAVETADNAGEEISQLARTRADAYRASIKKAIEKMNSAAHRMQEGKALNHTTDGNFIQYREWQLYSRPYFFYISRQ